MTHRYTKVLFAMLGATACGLPLRAGAQEASDTQGTTDDISRKLNDPGAAMVSVPIQYNYFGDVGPGGNEHNEQLKLQPVIPFVGAHSKFILRPILPLQWNHYPERKHGTGDLFVQGYYIPTRAGHHATEIGFGAAALLDTASHDSLGTGKYSIGPAFILVHKTGHWTIGMLANHVWSVGGDDDRQDVSQTALQPFFNRQLQGGWSLGFTSESSYNWKASSGNEWTVPIGASLSRVTRFGHMPVSFGLGGYYNLDRPDLASRWTARFTVTLVFPE